MQLKNIITQDGIFEEMDRICGTNYVEFPYRDKAARVNAALDWYFNLAFMSGKNQNFDDINQTSPPIDTQAIVSGANRYKFSDFTQTVLSYLRFEALDSAGKGIILIPETMADIERDTVGNESGVISGYGADTFQERYVNAPSGVPTHYIKYGDFIYLRPNPNYSKAAALLAYFERPLTKVEFLRYTVTQANPGVFTTASAHGMSVNGTMLSSTNGTIPTGISENVLYYIKTAPSTTTFTVAATLGGTAIEITANQSDSVHMCLHASQTLGIPVIHHPYIALQASVQWLVDHNKPQYSADKGEIMMAEKKITKFFSERNKDIKPQMLPNVEDCE